MQRKVSYLRIVSVTAATEVAMIGLAYGWVAVYSNLIQPGGTLADYQEYAQRASPIVSLVAGPLVFGALGFLLASRMKEAGERELRWIVGLYLGLDILIVLSLAEPLTYNLLLWIPNAITKMLAVWAGIRLAGRRR